MSTEIPTDPRDVLGRCLDIAEQLIAEGRKDEALTYLRASVLPALGEWARLATRETTPNARPRGQGS